MSSTLTTLPNLTSLSPSSSPASSPDMDAMSSRRNSKVHFNDDVQVSYTFPADEYDRNPIEPLALTNRDYWEYQIMAFEMNQSIQFEMTMRKLGLWHYFSDTHTRDDPFSSSYRFPVLDTFAGWTPRSQTDPDTKDLLMHLHSSNPHPHATSPPMVSSVGKDE